MKDILLTNNKRVQQRFLDSCNMEFVDGSLTDVMIRARDYVHKGHRLLSHPLSGSVKPGHTPYKSILISGETGALELDSLRIIEDSIVTCQKMTPRTGELSLQLKEDFMLVDLTLIEGAMSAHDGTR